MKLPWWMWPALQVGKVRSDLRAATDADAARLWELPTIIRLALLPAIAILVPLLISALHASTPPFHQSPPDVLAIAISEVFTESLPFMGVVLAVGIAAPSAGVLAVVIFAIGDLAATTLKGELAPLHLTLLARLITYALLWILAVEIPLMGRSVVEWRIGARSLRLSKRLGAIAVGAAVIAVMTYVWVQAAPLLVGVVFRMTSGWGSPTISAVLPLQENGTYLVGASALFGNVLLGLRYLGGQPHPAAVGPERSSRMPGGPIVTYLVTAAIAFVVLLGVVTQPIDLLILLPALLLAQPVGRAVMRITGLGRLLAPLPPPIRLILGIAVAVPIGWAVISVLGFQPMSGFFSMVVALAIGYVVATVFITGDGPSAPARDTEGETPTARSGVLTTLMLAIGPFLYLALPALALADNGGDHVDGWPAAAAAALAAASGGGLAALLSRAFQPGWWDRLNDAIKPPPRPGPRPGERPGAWYASTSAADFPPPQRTPHTRDTCVLTTACVTALGKSDDCHELMTFRRLRDEYLRRNPDGIAVIEDYYRTAPQVVAAVQATADAATIWPLIYAEWVEPVVELVDADRIDDATSLAISRYETIKRQYGVE